MIFEKGSEKSPEPCGPLSVSIYSRMVALFWPVGRMGSCKGWYAASLGLASRWLYPGSGGRRARQVGK